LRSKKLFGIIYLYSRWPVDPTRTCSLGEVKQIPVPRNFFGPKNSGVTGKKTRRAVGGDLIDMFDPRNCESRILHGEDRLAVGSEVISLKSWRLKHTGCYSRECDLLGWWRGALSIDTRRCLYVIFIALISD